MLSKPSSNPIVLKPGVFSKFAKKQNILKIYKKNKKLTAKNIYLASLHRKVFSSYLRQFIYLQKYNNFNFKNSLTPFLLNKTIISHNHVTKLFKQNNKYLAAPFHFNYLKLKRSLKFLLKRRSKLKKLSKLVLKIINSGLIAPLITLKRKFNKLNKRKLNKHKIKRKRKISYFNRSGIKNWSLSYYTRCLSFDLWYYILKF